MTDTPANRTLNYSSSLKHNSKEYKLDLTMHNNNSLIVTTIELSSISLNKYTSEYSIDTLHKLSKYFLLFDNISDCIPDIISKINKNEYSINIDENSFQLTIKLNIMNCNDFTFNLNKKERNINQIVESLCEAVNFLKEENHKLKSENNAYKKEVDILKKEIKEIKEKLLPLKKEKDIENENNKVFPGSKILYNIEEKKLILNWIKPNAKIKLTLLYQVSTDGDRISTFYSKVGKKSPTIVLLKTNAGYKCGGYTTKTWENTNNYKKDELAFLFSIDNKKKYQLKNDLLDDAIYTHSNYFAFGNGHDLKIYDQCKEHNSNQYSNFPCAYSGGNKCELTGGQYNFTVSELEVYYVEFI